MREDQIEYLTALRPALLCGKEVRVGEKGQFHGQIQRKPGLVEAGFVDIREGRFLTRAEVARLLGIPGLDSLHSQILARLQSEMHE